MRAGAADYVIKDRPKRLVPAVKRALSQAADRHRRKQAEEELRREKQFARSTLDATLANLPDAGLAGRPARDFIC